jgi:hypothetical protein
VNIAKPQEQILFEISGRIQLLRNVIQHIAPNLGIFVGNKAYLMVSSSSSDKFGMIEPKEAKFDRFGQTLLCFKWHSAGFNSLSVTMKTKDSSQNILEESVIFYLGDIQSEPNFSNMLENTKQEILNWVNQLKFIFF